MSPRFAPGRGDPGGQDHAKYLADALGITLEKLQAAEEAAAKAEAQADQILSRPQSGMFGGGPGGGPGGRGPGMGGDRPRRGS